MISFGNEAYIDKIVDYGTASVNLPLIINSVLTNSEHKQVNDIFRVTKYTGERYNQKK